jgi:hypothetical protein
MPIDVNKIIPNKNLAILDGILKGVSGMKKAEEEKQRSFIKNMFEQFKLQQENRKIDIDERKVINEEQRVEDEFQYKSAMLDNAHKEIDIKIANKTLDENRFAQAVIEAGFPYLERKQEIINNPKFSQQEKIVRLTAEQKLINDVMLERGKAQIDLQYKYGTTEIPAGGTFAKESAQKEKELEITTTAREKIANAQMANQSAIAGTNRSADLQIAGMNIASRESIVKARGELKGNASVDIGNYNKSLLEFNTDYTRQLEIAGDKVDKIKPDVMSRLSSKLENISSTHQALREMYPDRYITPPNLELGEAVVSTKWGLSSKTIKTFNPRTIEKSPPVTQRNTVPADQANYKRIINIGSDLKSRYNKAEARAALIGQGFDPKTIDKALGSIYNE